MDRLHYSRREFLTSLPPAVAVAIAAGGGVMPSVHARPRGAVSGPLTTAFIYDDRFKEHVLGISHPESPERLSTIQSYIDQTGLAARVAWPVDEISAESHVRAVHSDEHFNSVMACPTTGEIALMAVARILGAVKAISDGRARNAFCAIRPPGHHARNNLAGNDGACQGEGFCFFSNAAIAARYAQSLGYHRVLIIDWDYHYGNGTQFFVRSDPSVVFYSTHHVDAYPGTGRETETGSGDAVGHTINVGLPAGATDSDILGAWNDIFIPRMNALNFEPDFIIISAGFDSRTGDTLGVFDITDSAFAEMTRRTIALADRYCGGRVLSLLEGGYNVDGQARAVCAHVATLAGLDWQQFIPSAKVTPSRRGQIGGSMEIRQGMLRIPEREARLVTRIAVLDASGRELYQVSGAEIGRTVVDLWKGAMASGNYVALVAMKDGTKRIVPFDKT